MSAARLLYAGFLISCSAALSLSGCASGGETASEAADLEKLNAEIDSLRGLLNSGSTEANGERAHDDRDLSANHEIAPVTGKKEHSEELKLLDQRLANREKALKQGKFPSGSQRSVFQSELSKAKEQRQKLMEILDQ